MITNVRRIWVPYAPGITLNSCEYKDADMSMNGNVEYAVFLCGDLVEFPESWHKVIITDVIGENIIDHTYFAYYSKPDVLYPIYSRVTTPGEAETYLHLKGISRWTGNDDLRTIYASILDMAGAMLVHDPDAPVGDYPLSEWVARRSESLRLGLTMPNNRYLAGQLDPVDKLVSGDFTTVEQIAQAIATAVSKSSWCNGQWNSTGGCSLENIIAPETTEHYALIKYDRLLLLNNARPTANLSTLLRSYPHRPDAYCGRLEHPKTELLAQVPLELNSSLLAICCWVEQFAFRDDEIIWSKTNVSLRSDNAEHYGCQMTETDYYQLTNDYLPAIAELLSDIEPGLVSYKLRRTSGGVLFITARSPDHESRLYIDLGIAALLSHVLTTD